MRYVQAQITPASIPVGQHTLAAMRIPHGSLYGADIWGLGTILYAPTESGDFVYGHDGQNDPAINAAVRINPDTGDAFIALVSGGPSLATLLGFEWVYWQTGVPDVLGLGTVINNTIQLAAVGAGVILLLAIALAWWLRRRRTA